MMKTGIACQKSLISQLRQTGRYLSCLENTCAKTFSIYGTARKTSLTRIMGRSSVLR